MALQKIGPRRNNILFSLAAPFTVILNIIFLNHLMNTISLIGCFVVFLGVKKMETFWPGPLTLVLKARKEIPRHLHDVNGSIAMGYVSNLFSKSNTRVFLEVRGKKIPASICDLPFYKKNYVKGEIDVRG